MLATPITFKANLQSMVLLEVAKNQAKNWLQSFLQCGLLTSILISHLINLHFWKVTHKLFQRLQNKTKKND